jgi:hypothetical protein
MKRNGQASWMKKAAFPVLSAAFSATFHNVKFMAIQALGLGAITLIPEMEFVPSTKC